MSRPASESRDKGGKLALITSRSNEEAAGASGGEARGHAGNLDASLSAMTGLARSLLPSPAKTS